MNRRDFLKRMAGGILTLGALGMAPNAIANLLVQHPERSSRVIFDGEGARITAVGIGPLGAATIGCISKEVSDVSCYQVLFDAGQRDLSAIGELLGAARTSDLLFIVCGFDDAYSGSVFEAIADTARQSGVLTIAVTPDHYQHVDRIASTVRQVSSLWPVRRPSFSSGNRLIQGHHSATHFVKTISNMITHQCLIGMDFADVRCIMTSGGIGKVGVGLMGLGRGAEAALMSLSDLEAQRFPTSEATAVLGCVHGSQSLSMNDFDDAVRVVHDSIHPDANIIIGLLIDESWGEKMMVTVMATKGEKKASGPYHPGVQRLLAL
jgi:cell division protein FtsZ